MLRLDGCRHLVEPVAHYVYCQALRRSRGLISYGVDFAVMFGKAADYVAKILKGEKPANLPVEQATKFETVVNLQDRQGNRHPTADVDLLRADQVIE